MPPKRKAGDADTAAELKKCRSAIDALADEFICPITQELPIDPVMAEDGRVYEWSAIESWLARAGQQARSPVTNEPMGPHLLPALQVRNNIKGMVQSGALSGSKADGWKARLAGEEEKARRHRHECRIAFELPFCRGHVFGEFAKPETLGCRTSDVTLWSGSADGSGEPEERLALGVLRRVEHAQGGTSVYRTTRFEENSSTEWEQETSDSRGQRLAARPGRRPTVTTVFSDTVSGGTAVELTIAYDFLLDDRGRQQPPLDPSPSSQVAQGKSWTAEMQERGYRPLE